MPSDWNESLYPDLQEMRQEGMWKLPHNCSDLARKQGTLEGTAIVASTCRIQVDATIVRYFHVSRRGRRPASAPRSSGGPCQSSEMATLLNSLSFVFKISFLPKTSIVLYIMIIL